MKTIGLLGGMSWESSSIYYKLINERVKEKLGKHHSAKSLMYSVDFQHIKDLQFAGKWDEATVELINAAKCIEKGGADFLLICTNTMHKMAEDIQTAITMPVLHIADMTGEAIKQCGITKIGLLATKFTMEQEFYKGRLQSNDNIEVIVPNERERNIIHDVIYNELCLGKVRDESKRQYVEIIDKLIEQGAEGIILGCTEITMLIKEQDISVPVFDTTKIHAIKAADYAMNEE
ncbi:aspartate/glutamate racemase family protein [Cytobacillus sp. IB215316]|uniref:aspartate/glutamate racemase family protein n=1 Tax=Cytobacillus sp. IB215316 TaxID=3097354 RepID=UPI002A12B9E5|nr:aspartate/glutamate racemase family protein [Cytobacillus sp. IB215316]MDX8362580.1 aspartate/glutamate racemase family protein [Cytobacillus sp. IB215316]